MEFIIKRLLENKNSKLIGPGVFNIKAHSDEAYDLEDAITYLVAKEVGKYGDNIDIDDYRLEAGREGTSGDRSITYKSQVYIYNNGKEIPLKKRAQDTIVSDLSSLITLPSEDDRYEYSVNISFAGTELTIRLSREERVSW